MNNYQELIRRFQTLTTQTKLSFSLALVVIILSMAYLSWYILSPTYAVLFNQLTDQDANSILTQLDQEQIHYQIRNNGQDILIDKNLIPKTRLKIMSSSTQMSANVGFELFDNSDFGMTDFSQKIKYQRALQGELERTISGFDEVNRARVHLMIPEQQLFDQKPHSPKAAVTLNLKKPLTPKQILGIQQLISSSIPHLQAKKVVVVDQNGNTLSTSEPELVSAHLAAKKSLEHYLTNKVSQMLEPIFSKDQFIVKIDASINYDEVQSELIHPQSQGQVLHEKTITNATHNKLKKSKTNQVVTSEKSYQYGQSKQIFKRANGNIERLSISVLIPKNTDDQSRILVQKLVKNIIGFNEQRGDSISVEALLEQHPQSSLPEIPQLHNTAPNNTHFPAYLFIMFLIALAILLKPKRHKKTNIPEQVPINPVPGFTHELSQQDSLFIAIILEQGRFSWQEAFLASCHQGLHIHLLLKQVVHTLKPATKTLVWQLWHKQSGFNQQIEVGHG